MSSSIGQNGRDRDFSTEADMYPHSPPNPNAFIGSPPRQPIGGVQVIGMSAPLTSQSLARKASDPSSSSSLSPSPTPHYSHEVPGGRNAHVYSSAKAYNQASFSGANPSPIGSDQEEMTPSATFGAANYDAAVASNPRYVSSASNRKAHMGHGVMMLSHKDSFGGTQGIARAAGSRFSQDSAFFGESGLPKRNSSMYGAYPGDERDSDDEMKMGGSGSGCDDSDLAAPSQYSNFVTPMGSATEPIEVLGNTMGRNQANVRLGFLQSQGSDKVSSLSAAVAAASAGAGASTNYRSDQAFERQASRESIPGSFFSGDEASSRAHERRGSGISTSQSLASGMQSLSVQPGRAAGAKHNLSALPPDDMDGLSTMADSGRSRIESGPQTTAATPISSSSRGSANASATRLVAKSTPVSASSSQQQLTNLTTAMSSIPTKANGQEVATSSRAVQEKLSAADTPAPKPKAVRVEVTRSSDNKASSSSRRERGDKDRSGLVTSSSSSRHLSSRDPVSRGEQSSSSDPSRNVKPSSRTLPQLPMASDVKAAPPPSMYWSRTPVHGSVPRRSFRAHTTTLCDEVMWLFGGCDNKGCFRDLWCFDTETMCWSRPKVTGDTPPARRAHSATMVNKRMFVFAGGDGPNYFNDLYIFDTVSLRWSKPEVWGTSPSPRRAHTCNYYEGQLIIFGGGNGVGALNDVHTLDVTDFSRLEWRKIECKGKIPIGRGYHTTNLVDGKLIVIGGSDGHMSFNDIHILRFDTQMWYQVKTDEIHNRLGHTATQVGSYLFIFGGHDSKTYTSELLTLNLVNLQWEPRRVCGSRPPGRGYHQAWLRDSRLFIHGGFDGKEIFDDLHFLDLAACAYLPQITSFSVDLDDE